MKVLPPRARLYLAAVAVLAAGTTALVFAVHDGSRVERPFLVAAVALLIGLEHLFATREIRRGREGETTTHEEAYIVALALLEPAPAVVVAVGIGFVIGSAVSRREPVKAFFNVSAMVLAVAAAMLVVEALGGGGSDSRAALAAVVAGALVFAALNRVLISGILTLVGAGSLRANMLGGLGSHGALLAANIAIGVLAGFAAREDIWVLALGLVALVVLHYALAGHGRARAERQKLADIVEWSSNGILSLDRSGRVASWSAACTQITGYTREEILGMRFTDLATLLEAETVDYPQPPEGRRYAIRVRTKDGALRWLVVARTRLPEGGDVLIVHDDTVRRNLDAVRTAQLQERMWSDLVASVSHELRTPLTSIIGFAETLLSRRAPTGEQDQFLTIIRDQARRLEALVGDLLDVRALEEAGLELQLEELDLAELLKQQTAAFESQLTRHQLRLELPDEPLLVQADRRRVEQVVSNLLSNAIKYSPGGGAVSISVDRRDGSLMVAVRDEGVGIAAEHRDEVFAPFFRADPAGETAGTGLGLAISRRIVRRHGGDMGFDSTPGKGSTFFFELPVAADEVSPEP